MRRTLSSSLASVLALTVAFGLFAAPAGAQAEPTQNIVQIAQGNPDLSTLVTAVTEAGLVETLSGPGPFTVFAPTNAAFEALPAGTLDTLLANPDQLAGVLKLHVISGEVDSSAATAAAGTNVETLGGPVAVELEGDTLTVGGAAVVTADIQATNGVIHVIDSVITEPANAAAPSGVDTGNAGLAAASDREPNVPLLVMLGTVAIIGVVSSTVTLRRARQRV